VETGCGASTLTTGRWAAARYDWLGTVELNACPVAVAPGGATIVTFVTLVTLLLTVLLLLLMFVTLLFMRIPVFITGGALVTTAGGVPIGAGTM